MNVIREFEYPFDDSFVIRKKKMIKKLLLNHRDSFIDKKIAILGGFTTNLIKEMLELSLLNFGIRPEFYESEYNRFFEEGAFQNEELLCFAPDIIYICTSNKNIDLYPNIKDSFDDVEKKKATVIEKYKRLWDNIESTYGCQIIQNNFEYPTIRLMGNKDCSDIHGKISYICDLNKEITLYARVHEKFYICDINYLSSSFGLSNWFVSSQWHAYKYAISVEATPILARNISYIIKSLFGLNKKVLNLDLDNTLWGGVISEEGVENINIGNETPIGQSYYEFQKYIKEMSQLGILLTVNSKNDKSIAESGLNRSDSLLKVSDFISFKANWKPKSENIKETAKEMNLLPESFVFIDDNPAERHIVREQVKGVKVPEANNPDDFMDAIDKSGFFECTTFSEEDRGRNEMYLKELGRIQLQTSYDNYEDYLKSLEMKAEIQPFKSMYYSRISQLTNKSNQFNLTTLRCTQKDIESMATDPMHITLYGKLSDRFGDNGVVSVLDGIIKGDKSDELHIDLWLMSCRVLKRKMEYAMMDTLIGISIEKGISRIFGYYHPTKKNGMVKDLYKAMGFEIVGEEERNTIWLYCLKNNHQKLQDVIYINSYDSSTDVFTIPFLKE